MTTVKATFSVDVNDISRVMSLLRNAGFNPNIEGAHGSGEIPDKNGEYAVFVEYTHNHKRFWCIGEYASGWQFPYEIAPYPDGFEVIAWAEFPEVR